jgi:hypothetical protein
MAQAKGGTAGRHALRSNGGMSRASTPTLSQTTLHSFTPEDTIESPLSSIATAWLIKNKWVEPGGCLANQDDSFLTTAELGRALTKIATATPKTTSTTLATHLTHIQQAIHHLATILQEKNVQPLVNTMEDAIEQAMTARLIPCVMEKTEARLSSISERFNEMVQSSLGQLNAAGEALKGIGKTAATNLLTTAEGGAGPRSYALVTANQHQTHPEALAATAKQDKMERQVRIELKDPTKQNTLALPMRMLVKKANIALLGTFNTAAFFTAAQIVRDDSILLLANETSIVERLREPHTRQTFLDLFGGCATIKDRAFPVAVKFVPTRGEHANTSTFFGDEVAREIETANGLQLSDVMTVRWLKKPMNRWDGQKVATLVITLTSAMAAHRLIDAGVAINHGFFDKVERLQPKTDVVTMCYRCSAIGHIARDCTYGNVVCFRCGKEGHISTDCNNEDKSTYCTNCKTEGHTAGGGNCPLYTQEWQNAQGIVPVPIRRPFASISIAAGAQMMNQQGENLPSQKERAEKQWQTRKLKNERTYEHSNAQVNPIIAPDSQTPLDAFTNPTVSPQDTPGRWGDKDIYTPTPPTRRLPPTRHENPQRRALLSGQIASSPRLPT